MPRANLMSWEGSPYFRWVRMLDGERYRVGCHELPITRDQWTKEASVNAANAWWNQTFAKLNAAKLAALPHAAELKQLDTRQDFARRHGLEDEGEVIDAEILRVKQLEPHEGIGLDAATVQGIETAKMFGVVVPSDLDPQAAQVVFGAGAVWQDRLHRETTATPPERTIGALADKWLEVRQHEARSGVRSSASAAALKLSVRKFREFIGESSPVESITFDNWHRWYVHCAGMKAKRDKSPADGWSSDTAKKYFKESKQFVLWLVDKDILEKRPKNLSDKSHKFKPRELNIPTFDNAEIKTFLNTAKGVHRLILLLMLNLGATQKDVADLRRDQVNLKEGRIIRRRSKTGAEGRLVSYKLWKETLALLTEHMKTEGELALTTQSGKPWVWTETTAEGKLRKSDNAATIFNAIKKKIGMKDAGKSLKVFRKTSATRLNSHKEYRDLKYWFLGHSERTIADRHYVAYSQDQLDKAVSWLAKEYGIK